jgi:hypothetical protein
LQTSDIRKICEAPGAIWAAYGAASGTSPRFMTKSLLTDPRFCTEGGNLCVGWDSTKRHEPPYLTNTEFTDLFRGGWVGSWGSTTDQISVLINQALERGRMVSVALRDSGSAEVP